jgi:Domain of unknown function (DUF5668)
VGACLLAANLGFPIPHHIWSYWPMLLIGLGAIQLILPGPSNERLGGYWLIVVGIWGTINMFEIYGLHWGNSWPIFIIAAGLRVALGGILNIGKKSRGDQGSDPNLQSNNPSGKP